MQLTKEEDQELVKRMGYYADNPVAFVNEMFPWGENGSVLQSQTGADAWQVEILNELANSGKTETALQVAVASGHGIGKSALVAWIVLWYMSTRTNPQVVVTASTAGQLTSKTWREVAKWHKLALNREWFEWTATSLYLKEESQTWKANAVPWSAHNSEAFAGTHEENVLVIFDEASGIDDIIWEVTEGAMTTHGATWVAFGNPTRNVGRFRECFRKYQHRWITKQIDSRTAKMANTKQIEQWIADWGIDDDRTRIRILGKFPSSSTNQLIPYHIIARCQAYEAAGYQSMPVIMAVDVARFGDDSSVITVRQGRKVWEPLKFDKLDTMLLANEVVRMRELYNPDTIIVDSVGVGAGVVDRLRQLGYSNILEMNGAEKAYDNTQYVNLRAEMYFKLLEAMKQGIELPKNTTLQDELIAIEYFYARNNNRLQLKSKDDMKKEGIGSPDFADSLAMTYAFNVNDVHHAEFTKAHKKKTAKSISIFD